MLYEQNENAEKRMISIPAYRIIVVKTINPIHQLNTVTKKTTAITTSAMIGIRLKTAWLQKNKSYR